MLKAADIFYTPFPSSSSLTVHSIFFFDGANIWEIREFYVLDVAKDVNERGKNVEKLIFYFIDSVAGKASYTRHIDT